MIPLISHGKGPYCALPQTGTELVGLGFFSTGLLGIFGGIRHGIMEMVGVYGAETLADKDQRICQELKKVGIFLAVSTSMTITGFLLLNCSLTRPRTRRIAKIG